MHGPELERGKGSSSGKRGYMHASMHGQLGQERKNVGGVMSLMTDACTE